MAGYCLLAFCFLHQFARPIKLHSSLSKLSKRRKTDAEETKKLSIASVREYRPFYGRVANRCWLRGRPFQKAAVCICTLYNQRLLIMPWSREANKTDRAENEREREKREREEEEKGKRGRRRRLAAEYQLFLTFLLGLMGKDGGAGIRVSTRRVTSGCCYCSSFACYSGTTTDCGIKKSCSRSVGGRCFKLFPAASAMNLLIRTTIPIYCKTRCSSLRTWPAYSVE